MSKESLNLPYVILTGVIIVAILMIFLVVWPSFNSVQERKQELEALQDTISEKEDALLAIDRQKNELLQHAENEKVLQVVLPAEDNLDDIARIVHRYAQATGVTVNSITNDTSRVASDIAAARARGQAVDIPASVVPLETVIDLVGAYQQYRAFVELLQRATRIGDITAIQTSQLDPASGVVNAKVQIRFYKYQPQSNGE